MKASSILSTTESEVSNKTNNPDNPDNNTDAEEWKPRRSLIVGDSHLRESEISLFSCPKDETFLSLFSSFAEAEETR